MAFFTASKEEGTIDQNLQMSEEELRNAVIARILESNAFERHRMSHKDAKLSTLSQEEEFSAMEKQLKHAKVHDDMPAITYNRPKGTFEAQCSCGKEKFVFNMINDSVEAAHVGIPTKEMKQYQKDEEGDKYGRVSDQSNPQYNRGPPSGAQNISYNNGPRSSYKD